jgi:tetratricopeptide (TPR) repeat protein
MDVAGLSRLFFKMFPRTSVRRPPKLMWNLRPALMLSALLLAAATQPSAQAQLSPADTAAQAFKLGRFEEVDKLLQSATDPRSVAIKSRAVIARGRYEEAEKLLAKVAATAPTSDAALELGLLQLKLGRRAVGKKTLTTIADSLQPRSTAEYVRFGRAMFGLTEVAETAAERKAAFLDAQTALNEANRLKPNDPDILTALGEVWAATTNEPGETAKYFQAALKLDDTNSAALVGFAELALEQNPPDARTAIEHALMTNPNYEPAHLLSAQIALDERRRPDARASIDLALKVNPNSLEARSLDAAITFLEGRTADFERKVQQILTLQPNYGEVYRIVGDHAASNYRFDEAAELVRKGLAIDPDNTRAYADLGMHLLRTGDEANARKALDRSYSKDEYDFVTYNLLDLLDRLDKFETVQEGNITMKFAPEEAAVMREQALPLAKEALDALSKRWDMKIEGTVLIEMFPKHDDFAVRNLGLPGMIGALGACFGRVVTLDSPHARPPGQYNWQPTLWHELAHVVTLQLSNNRVPRWVTEGISVWEERRARPEWGREMDVSFAHAMDKDKVMKLNVLNEGFSDPSLISLAYHEASLVVEHLAATYGDASLKTLLRAYGRGLETDQAFKEAFNASLDDVQTTFDAKLEREFGPVRAALKAPEVKSTPGLEELKKLATENPGSFPVQMSLGQTLEESGDHAGAIAAFERAAKLVPSATGDDNPNKLIAAIALEQKDNTRAAAALEAVLKVDHADVESARSLIPLVTAIGNPARTMDAYQRLVNVDPFESTSHSALGRLAMQRKDLPLASRSFRSALATNPPDRATAHTDLAEAYMQMGRLADAKTQTLAALEIAPTFERAQDLLLRLVDGEPPK